MVYKLKIPKEVYDLKNLNNEPGQTYVWLKQSTTNGSSENNLDTINIKDCILKGKNSTVEVLKNKMNTVTNLSYLVSVCCMLSPKIRRGERGKKLLRDHGSMFYVFQMLEDTRQVFKTFICKMVKA